MTFPSPLFCKESWIQMAGFLGLPLKKTAEVNLIPPFTNYINTVYNTSDDNKAEVIQSLHVSLFPLKMSM